jgi:formyl-CoA transferase
MSGALQGLLVVSLEQAVAAPLATCRLADAGARIIKIERPEGDFGRGYDAVAKGESSYFVWLNRGKESVILDLRLEADKQLLESIIAQADVLVQNLKPGALEKLGFERERLRNIYPKLIIASISGFGEDGPSAERKAYDLLIQAEAGLASVTGGPEAPARVGISVVDVATGLATYEAILEALIKRGRTGEGADLRLSMFDATAELMTVPLLQHEGGKSPKRLGLAHPSIAPYGVFQSKDGVDILISIQSDREWVILARDVLGDANLGSDPIFATNVKRVAHRAETDAAVAGFFNQLSADDLISALTRHDIAFGRVSDMATLSTHPELRRITVNTINGPVSYPARAGHFDENKINPTVPGLGVDTDAVRNEFSKIES